MALALWTVGQKITAALLNAMVNAINATGSTSVVPTSVAFGSGSALVATGGKVTFSGASSVSVNGCFTSTYDNYTIEASWTHSTAANTNVRLRAAGSDNSSSVYDLQTLAGSSTTASAAQILAASSWNLSGVNADQENSTLTVAGPALAVATQIMSVNRATSNPMTSSNALSQRMLQHRSASAFDGFSFIASSGTISGTIRIYGWSNN